MENDQGEAAFAEQAFGLRTGEPGAQFSFAGDLVEPVQGVKAAKVHGDDGVEVTADRVQAADHTGAAAEGHHGDAMARAVLEDLLNVILIAGQNHRVGGVLPKFLAAQEIRCGLATRMEQPVDIVGPQVGLAGDRGEAGAVIGGQCAGGHLYVLDAGAGHLGCRHAQRLFEQGSDTGGQWFGQGRITPGVPGHRRKQILTSGSINHGLQYYR